MDTKEKNPLEVENESQVETIKYSKADQIYYGNLLKRLSNAQEMRDQEHDEFDGMTYLQYVEANRKGANTYIQPKRNREDTNFVSGTIRQKMLAYLASLNSLDLNPDIQAFDKENNEVKLLGEAMEDIIFKVGELDNDEEKRILRQYSLLEQGFVFVEESWEEHWRKKKTFTGKIDGKLSKTKKWKTKLERAFAKCTRALLMPENVYLGDITQFDMDKQPYLYTVEIRPYEEAKSIYGKFDNWKYVPRKIDRTATADEGQDLYSGIKLVDDDLKDQTEIIKYQDKWNDDYMIIINGVMMIDVGTPLSAVNPTGEYTIDKQINEIISPFFAYGKSIPARMKTTSALLDEMYRMAILKTQKSFAPPMANNTGQVLSSRIFAPGRVISGIDPDRLQRIDPDSRGVDSSEFHMLEMFQKNMDSNTVDPSYTGQQPEGSPTATQILEVQRQAKMMIGLTVFVCSQLEKKIAWSRIYNILHNWFKGVGKTASEEEGKFIERYRSISRTKMIPGKGMGEKIVRLTDKLPTPIEVMDEEDELSTPEKPVRIIYLSPKEILKALYFWYITVTPKERKTDALSKVMFDEMMNKAVVFPNINIGYLGERFAEVWEENPAKMFNLEAPAPQPGAEGQGPQAGVPNIPSPQNAAGGLTDAISKSSK